LFYFISFYLFIYFYLLEQGVGFAKVYSTSDKNEIYPLFSLSLPFFPVVIFTLLNKTHKIEKPAFF